MQCVNPLYIKRNDGYANPDGTTFWKVPCGRCVACRRERGKAWALRLMMESLSWKDSIFLTLTYDDEHLPRVSNTYRRANYEYEIESPTLLKKDLQKFWKRLRKDMEGRKIKYYAVGEYGDNTFRPHYHAIVYGLSMYDKQLIEDNWQKGLVDVGCVTLESCNYVAGYIQKKLYGSVADDVYGDRLKPFSCMSKGIGRQFFSEHFDELLRDGFLRYRDKKLPLPRYFWNLCLEDDSLGLSPIDVLRVKRLIRDKAVESSNRFYDSYDIPQYERWMYEEEKQDQRKRTLDAKNDMFKRGKL